MNPEYSEDYLQHYGVLGMKWGVRRGNYDKAYAKASKKLVKLDKKATKYQNKARKHMTKYDTTWYNRNAHRDLADKNRQKAIKNMAKASKWLKQMEKTFKDTPIKMTQEQIDIGRRYTQYLDMRVAASDYRRFK